MTLYYWFLRHYYVHLSQTSASEALKYKSFLRWLTVSELDYCITYTQYTHCVTTLWFLRLVIRQSICLLHFYSNTYNTSRCLFLFSHKRMWSIPILFGIKLCVLIFKHDNKYNSIVVVFVTDWSGRMPSVAVIRHANHFTTTTFWINTDYAFPGRLYVWIRLDHVYFPTTVFIKL